MQDVLQELIILQRGAAIGKRGATSVAAIKITVPAFWAKLSSLERDIILTRKKQ
jgi:hypothetical protein